MYARLKSDFSTMEKQAFFYLFSFIESAKDEYKHEVIDPSNQETESDYAKLPTDDYSSKESLKCEFLRLFN